MKKNLYEFRYYLVILGVLLLAIIVGRISCTIYVHSFNNQERAYTPSLASEDLSMAINPRGAASDHWTKSIPGTLGISNLWYGTIYEGVLTNTSTYDISSWSMLVNIHESCAISDAWCGNLEIHRNAGVSPRVQTLDLQDLNVEDLTLDYVLDGPDTLIFLTEGDYFIYQPSQLDGEYPIQGTAEDNQNANEVGIGMIFYSLSENRLSFDDIEITYYLHMELTQLAAYRIIQGISLLWVIVAIAFASSFLSAYAAQKRIQQDELIIEQSINVLTKFVDAKDSYTNGHSHRVAQYSYLLGQKLGFSHKECRHLYYIALMHDCGKVGIPDAILKKPARLDDDEYHSIMTHTTVGAEMLNDFTSIKGIRDGALYHHERYDGNGYPTGKKGEDIPLVGRIICVADAFDAMNSQRCYRSRRSEEYILSELKSNRGKQFDPKIVDYFLELIQEKKIRVGAE